MQRLGLGYFIENKTMMSVDGVFLLKPEVVKNQRLSTYTGGKKMGYPNPLLTSVGVRKPASLSLLLALLKIFHQSSRHPPKMSTSGVENYFLMNENLCKKKQNKKNNCFFKKVNNL